MHPALFSLIGLKLKTRRSVSGLALPFPPYCFNGGTSRSNKPKAGPRKLNLTRISAEKQRAALGLDKDLDEENNDGGVSFVALSLPLSVALSCFLTSRLFFAAGAVGEYEIPR